MSNAKKTKPYAAKRKIKSTVKSKVISAMIEVSNEAYQNLPSLSYPRSYNDIKDNTVVGSLLNASSV